ncbi:hypothetical protein ABPG74_020458 [Tetrahymena malaccensis]
MAHVELLYENKEQLEIENLFKKNSILINTWYHQNITNLHMLDEKAQKIVDSFSSLSVLQRVFDYSQQVLQNSNKRVLLPNYFYLAFQEQGLLFLNGKNTTFKNIPPQQNCYKGLYQFDPRCSQWFKEGSLQNFIQMINYQLLDQNISNQLIMTQKLYTENENKQSDQISLLGYQFSFSFLLDYFQNIGSATKQIYFINPQSQIIYNEYNKQQCNSSTYWQTVSDCELKYLQSFQDQKKLNGYIVNNFGSSSYEQINRTFNQVIDTIQSNTITFPYNRNGSESQIILSPIYIFDKTVQFTNVQNMANYSDAYISIPLLQILIISNENIIQSFNQIDESFKTYFIIVNIMLVIIALFCIAFTIFYSNQIITVFYASLDQIIDLLDEMNCSNFSKKIFEIDIEEFFLSKETQELYQIVKEIYFSLTSMSNDFYVKDQTEVLLTLSQSLQFFKFFKNQHALGIIYNNMASILLNQGFYLKALKFYSEAIFIAKCSIQEFCNDNHYAKSTELLLQFTYLFDQPSNYNQKLKNASTKDKLKSTLYMKSSNQEIQSMSIKIEDFSKNQNISKTATVHILLEKIQDLQRNWNQKKINQINVLCEEYLQILKGQYQNYKKLSISHSILPQKTSQNKVDILSRKKILSQNAYLNNLTVSLIDEKSYVGKRKSTLLMNSTIINEKNLTGDQNLSQAQSLLMLNNQDTQIKQIQFTNQNVQKSQGIEMDFSAINLVQSIEITKTDDNNIQQNNNLEFGQNYITKQSKFNKLQYTQNSKKDIINYQNINQISKNNISNNENQTGKSFLSINHSQNKIKSKFIQKSKIILTLNKLKTQSKLKDKQQLNNNSKNQKENFLQNFEEQFQKNRKKLIKLENQYQIFNYYSTKNLLILTQFAKAEYHLNYYEEYNAAQILIQILEESHFIISNFPYLILNKLNNIFDKAKIKSKEFDIMYQKFNPEIYFQIGVIFACGLNSEQVFNSAKLTSDIVGNILNSEKDQLGIFLVSIQDIQFNQYMTYTKLKTVKEMMKIIIGDIFRFTTLKKDQLKLAKICEDLNAFNNYNKQFNIATESSQSQSIDNKNQTPYSFAFDQEEYMNKLSESFDQQFKNQILYESNDNISKINNEKSVMNIKSLSDINTCNNYQQNLSFSNFSIDYNNSQPKKNYEFENNYLSPHLQVSQNNLNDSKITNKSQRRHTIQVHKNSNNEQQKFKNTSISQLPHQNFDTITVQNLSQLNESVIAQNNQLNQDSFEVEANFLNNMDRNHQFYISIRMALNEFQDKDIVLKYQKILSNQDQTIISQCVTLIYAKQFINIQKQQMFQQEVNNNMSIMQIITFQIQQETQKLPQYLNLVNNYFFRLLNGQIKLENRSTKTLIHTEKLYQNDPDSQDVISLFKKNPLLINTWYHKNFTLIQDLSDYGQILIYNASFQDVLLRPIKLESQITVSNYDRKIKISDYFQGFNYQGIYFSGGNNSTFSLFQKDQNCGNGYYSYDPRCRFWYKDTENQQSIQFNKPNLIYSQSRYQMETSQCQRIKILNKMTNQIDLFSILCMYTMLNDLNIYFNNINNYTSNVYYIDSKTQSVIFNTQNSTINNQNVVYLSDLEQQYLSNEDLQILNEKISQIYNKYQYKQQDFVGNDKQQNFKNNLSLFEIKRNGKNIQVAINPIIIYDKAPNYMQDIKFNGKPFQLQVPYLQVNFLSDQIYQDQANQFQDFFDRYFLFLNISIGILCVISFFITVNYLTRIQNMIYSSIEQLITLLINMSQVDQKLDIFNFESTNMFLSKETSELFDSLKQIHLFLQQTSEKFFEQNSTEILLKLTKNIEFLKKFQNLNAVGIAYNNIGYIFLSQELYMQALESFQQSIIYAKYEIQQFIKQNPSSQYNKILEKVSFNELNSKITTQDQKKSSQDKQKKIGEDQFGRSIAQSFKQNRQLQDYLKITTNQNQQKIINCGYFENEGNQSQLISKTTPQLSSSLPFKRLERQKVQKNKMEQNDECDSKYNTNNSNIHNYNQVDEHFEYVDKILQSLYQRKKNYIYTLLQFQENLQQTEKYGLKYNFWKEIKILMKELQNLPQVSQIFIKNKIVMNALIAKCQYYLQKNQKADQILQECEKDIQKYRMQEEEMHLKKLKRFSQYQESSYYKQDINIPSYIQKNVSRQTADYEYSNTKKKSTIIELSNINLQNISNIPIQLTFPEDQQSLISFSSKLQVLPQCISKNQIFSLNHSTSNLNKINNCNSPSKLKQQRRLTKKIDQLEGDASDLSLWNSDELEQNIDQSNNKFKQFINIKRLNKFNNQNDLNNRFQKRISFNSTNQYHQSYYSKQTDLLNAYNYKKKETRQSILFTQKIKQNNQIVKEDDIEQLFKILRKYEKEYQDNTQIEKFISVENIDCMFNYCKAEFLFTEKNFIQSGLILANLFETKQSFMSQIRYKITFLLKQVLDKLILSSEEFNQFYYKFNPNITTQVIMIYCQPLEIKQILETSQLLSNLISTTLTNEKDQIEILFTSREMKTITTYLSLIKTSKIKSMVKYVVQNIIEILTRQNSQQKEQILQVIDQIIYNTKRKYFSNQINNLIITSSINNENILNQQQKSNFQINNQQIYKIKQQKQQASDIYQIQNINFNGSQYQQKEKLNPQNKLADKNNIFKQFLDKMIEDDQDQSNINDTQQVSCNKNLQSKKNVNCGLRQVDQQQLFYQDNQNNNLLDDKKSDQKKMTKLNQCRQILNNQGDRIFENSISDISNQQDCSQKKLSNDLQFIITKNQYFHTSTKKAISDLLIQNKLTFQSQVNKSLGQKLQTHLYTQQFIIFSTDEICIIEDEQFQNLCEILRKYYIQLIIYSNNKGNNFLECMDNQVLVYQGIEIIRVFYSNQDIYDYLKNSRDTYHKYIYPIVIQHF